MEKRETSCSVGGNAYGCSHYGKKNGDSSKKLKIELPYNLAISLLGIYSKKIETLIWKDIRAPMFIAALFTIAKVWKQPRCPSIDGQIKKMWYIHTHTMEYYSAIKRNEILPFATTWMDLEGIMLSKISWTGKDKYCMISFICGI